MIINEVHDTPDSTYFTTSDVEPRIGLEGAIELTCGHGTRRSWGAPQTNNTILISTCDFAVIFTGFSHKHGGGQFYRYFVRKNGETTKVSWRNLTDDERLLVLDAYKDVAPAWARVPGKLASDRKTPNRSTFIAYKIMHLVDDLHFTSLYDDTKWELGKRNAQKAESGHGGGFYVHRDMNDIKRLFGAGELVRDDLVQPGEYVLVECECSGRSIQYSSGKVACTYCKPIRIVERMTLAED